jgi:hypothetical protein
VTFSKLTWHKRTHGHKFTGAEFRVLMSIFDHSSADGTNSHPGIKRMMAETGYGKATVSTAVTGLKARGWIRETRKGSGVSGNASVFDLVPDAPSPPSSSPGVEQPSEVVRLERTSSSPGANQVVRLEQSPSDPGLSDPGSDPDSSDQEEVRYSPNHLEDQDETGLESRSLAVGGSTSTSPDSDPWGSTSEPAAEGSRPLGLQPATAREPVGSGFGGCRLNPFCTQPQPCDCKRW